MSASSRPSRKVITSTTDGHHDAPATNSTWAEISTLFQSASGSRQRRDRVYGAAGQQPDYQVSSQIYGASSVRRHRGRLDDAVLQHDDHGAQATPPRCRMKNFGSCFTTSNAALMLSALQVKPRRPRTSPPTGSRSPSSKGWARGGVAELDLPGADGPLHLVMVVPTAGHYEVTLGALVDAVARRPSCFAREPGRTRCWRA